MLMKMPSLLMGEKKRAKFLLMNKAVVTLLICSFRGVQVAIAHYLYALSYYIIAVTGGGCFERTEISFIPFQGRIQRSVAITYPFEEQPDITITSSDRQQLIITEDNKNERHFRKSG